MWSSGGRLWKPALFLPSSDFWSRTFPFDILCSVVNNIIFHIEEDKTITRTVWTHQITENFLSLLLYSIFFKLEKRFLKWILLLQRIAEYNLLRLFESIEIKMSSSSSNHSIPGSPLPRKIEDLPTRHPTTNKKKDHLSSSFNRTQYYEPTQSSPGRDRGLNRSQYLRESLYIII